MPQGRTGGAGSRLKIPTLPAAASGVQKLLAAFFYAPASDLHTGERRCPDNFYLVRLKTPKQSSQVVEAATLEVHGEHLVFLDSRGKLAASFPTKIVETWIQINP